MGTQNGGGGGNEDSGPQVPISSEITREIITQELKAAEKLDDRRRRRSGSSTGSTSGGIIYRRGKNSPAEENQSSVPGTPFGANGAAAAVAAVQMVKDKFMPISKSFTSELKKLGQVLSPTGSVKEKLQPEPVAAKSNEAKANLKLFQVHRWHEIKFFSPRPRTVCLIS